MSRPKVLDLFCGAGGCSVGYARAGWDVTGVDKEPHADYPFELIVDDAMRVLDDLEFVRSFDAVHGSPPCPRYSSITAVNGTQHLHPDLVGPVRERFVASGLPWVIENVPRAPLLSPVVICGKAMGLPYIKRHRLFESNLLLMSPGCACDSGPAYGVYGDHGDKNPARPHPDGHKRWGKARDVAHAQQIMGIDWMTSWDDLADAIPPAYTQFIGEQLLTQIQLSEAS